MLTNLCKYSAIRICFHLLLTDYYQKILPNMGGLTNIKVRGFGYSFSNKETRSGSEVLPYFVVSSVNDDYNSTIVKNNQAESDQAILLDFFCVNLREKCNSKVESSKKTLKPIDGNLLILFKLVSNYSLF